MLEGRIIRTPQPPGRACARSPGAVLTCRMAASVFSGASCAPPRCAMRAAAPRGRRTRCALWGAAGSRVRRCSARYSPAGSRQASAGLRLSASASAISAVRELSRLSQWHSMSGPWSEPGPGPGSGSGSGPGPEPEPGPEPRPPPLLRPRGRRCPSQPISSQLSAAAANQRPQRAHPAPPAALRAEPGPKHPSGNAGRGPEGNGGWARTEGNGMFR